MQRIELQVGQGGEGGSQGGSQAGRSWWELYYPLYTVPASEMQVGNNKGRAWWNFNNLGAPVTLGLVHFFLFLCLF